MPHRTIRFLAPWLVLLFAAVALADPIRFSITADNRGEKGFVTVLEQIKALPGGGGAFMLAPGDIDPPKATRDNVAKVFGPAFGWYPVVGNHESGSKSALAYLRDYYEQQLKGKVTPGPEGSTQTTYSFDAGDVHIAVIDEYWDGDPRHAEKRQGKGDVVAPLRDWLKADLVASKKPWKLVAGHEPAYPQSDADFATERHVEGSLDRNAKTRDAFWKLLEEQGVAAYLCGHTHRYSRYQPEGSKVWQLDSAQARGNKDWKYDAFVIVTADEKTLKFEVYRNLAERGKFALRDTLKLEK